MVNKIYYFITSAKKAQAEEELQSVSGSFGPLSGVETTTNDVIVGVNVKTPNFKLFDEIVSRYSTRYEDSTIDEILSDKNKTRKLIESE